MSSNDLRRGSNGRDNLSAHSARIEIFGFLKKLLHKAARLRKTRSTKSDSTSAPVREAAAEAVPASSPNSYSSFGPAPARKTLGVEVPLQKILADLPVELRPRIRQTNVGQQAIAVRLEKILPQLSKGVVKVSFGELRQTASGVFSTENDQDQVLVALPLADILSQLNPAFITRRRVQRQVEVPADISSPFDPSRPGLTLDSNGGGETDPVAFVRPSRQVSPAALHPAAPARGGLGSVPPPSRPAMPLAAAACPSASTAALEISTDVAPPGAGRKPVAKGPTAPPRPAPKPAVLHPSAAPITPLAPVALAPTPPATPLRLNPPAPSTMPAAVPTTKAPIPSPAMPAVAPAAPVATRPVFGSVRDAKGDQPAVASSSAAVQPPAKSAAAAEPLLLAMGALAEAWPDALRKEILGLNLAEATVEMPAEAVEQALKQGRIAFTWKTIRSWVKPAVPATVSPHDSCVLDLPLKLVVPLFLARQRQTGKSQQKVSIDEDIPNPFSGLPQAETSTPAGAPTAQPNDTTVRVHESEVERPKPGTKFAAKYPTPNEVVSRAAALDGVAGALIALPDGLMVANRLPAELNADALAAFLPQIFGKVSQCAKELHMGELNELDFTVEAVPWKIFRGNAIFFGAFGREEGTLPTAQLAGLVAELDHKPK